MEKIKILVAEDEESIREFIVINLKLKGYDVVDAVDGIDALEKYMKSPNEFTVAVLDVMMPGMNGFELCKKLRELSNNLGIVILTAKTQETDKVSGLLLGADDYITKPFSTSEFLARIDVLVRRIVNSQTVETVSVKNNTLISGSFTLDLNAHSLKQDGKYIELTQVEFQILQFFFENQGKTLTRSDILNNVWGTEYVGEEKIVDVNIRRIRKKIEVEPSQPRHLLTIWGLGYKWV